MIQIYTDGSCKDNTLGVKNKGGIGVVILKNNLIITKISKTFKNTTNNKMELLAIVEGLIYCLNKGWQNQEIVVYSDSQYCVQGLSSWINNWKKYEFAKKNETLLNSDIWITLDILKSCFEFLSFEWVKGHNGDKYNELADELSSNYDNLLI
jgi:ribonuclease HI